MVLGLRGSRKEECCASKGSRDAILRNLTPQVKNPPEYMSTLERRLKNQGKRFARGLFEFGQAVGIDILPRHFYSEIPNIRELRKETQWRKPLSLEGIRGDVASQIAFVHECTDKFRDRIHNFSIQRRAVEMNGSNGGYGEIEADFLYCFVRSLRPGTIVQVGCGVSTAVCLLASRDEGYNPKIICIEPCPTLFLRNAHESGNVTLIQKKLQDLTLKCSKWIGKGDLFFVDSSHTLGPAGEVSQIILEILPRLVRGAYVHFHDITFPYDYDPHVLSSALFFWHETALLYAFLCMNERYSIAASLSLLHHLQRLELENCFPHMRPAEFVDGIMSKEGHYPSAIYLRT
jgi:Methyltransferase domain